MTKLNDAVSLNVDVLSEMVERQLDEVAGGGYSQFTAHHFKDGSDQPEVPTLG